MNAGELLEWLEANDACTEAREWVAGKTLYEAWHSCNRASWLLWLLRKCWTPQQYDDFICTLLSHPGPYFFKIRRLVTYDQVLAAMKDKGRN